jgi:hypothetical protein
VGNDEALKHQLISALHDSAIGGHSVVSITHRRLKNLFARKGMKTDVHTFVKSCQVCRQAKPERVHYPGKLQPLPVPTEA